MKLVDYEDFPSEDWSELPSPILEMKLPESSSSVNKLLMSLEKLRMPIFSLEAQASSSKHHEEEKEYVRVGAERLSHSFLTRWEHQEKLTPESPRHAL